MRFTVPQFIEHETKIVGPLTFKQFIYIGAAGAVVFFLYFSLAKKNFLLFLLVSIVLMLMGTTLAFLKIGGRGLPTIIMNFFHFSISPKMYIWKKTDKPVEVLKKEIKKTGVPETILKVAGESQLKKLSTRVETKNQ